MHNISGVWRVACHTDHVGPGSIFVAIKGMQHDGADYLAQAIAKGATTVVVEQAALLPEDVLEIIHSNRVTLVRVDNARKALAYYSAQAYDYPARKMIIIGITGTKGKTTTAYMVHHILRHAGMKAGLISTVENKIDDVTYPHSLTTPQPDYMHMFLDACVNEGITHVVIESAAQAFSLHRLDGILFDVAVFTNFGHEHLEFYAHLEDYFHAKCRILDHVKPGAPLVLNVDDHACAQLMDRYVPVVPVNIADLSTVTCVPHITFTCDDQTIQAPHLMGMFNVYNMVAALRVGQQFQIPLGVMAQAMETFVGVQGRLQKHELANGALCYIDYAHTPDSYKQLLSLLRTLTHKLIVVFGCCGGRDPFKRPIMGSIAEQFADHIVLTSDNPRHEDPVMIVQDIMQGMTVHTKVHTEPDRYAAIVYAYGLSDEGSIIAILGKGPDEFQHIKDTKLFFSDTQVIKQWHVI